MVRGGMIHGFEQTWSKGNVSLRWWGGRARLDLEVGTFVLEWEGTAALQVAVPLGKLQLSGGAAFRSQVVSFYSLRPLSIPINGACSLGCAQRRKREDLHASQAMTWVFFETHVLLDGEVSFSHQQT